MYRKEKSWNVKAVILVALIGVIMGVIYQYVFNPLYNATKMALSFVGQGPLADELYSGLWYMAAPLAMYFVPTFGSGVIGETLAATVEMAFGGQWGALTILEGAVQGAFNEIGFFPKKENYDRFSWTSLIIGAICCHVAAFIMCYFIYGWNAYKPSLLIEMFIAGMASAVFFDAVLVKWITKLFDKIMK